MSLASSAGFAPLALAASAAMAVFAACAPIKNDAFSLGARNERLFYELDVTLPGSRSQGVRGRLYGRQGQSIVAAADGAIIANSETPGQTSPALGGSIETDAGTFVTRPLVHIWDVSGLINEPMLSEQMNDPSVRGPTRFRLYVHAECTRSEGWRGELLTPNGEPVAQQQTPIQTPMGRFVYRRSEHLFGQNGWFPEAWPQPRMSPSHWPCNTQ